MICRSFTVQIYSFSSTCIFCIMHLYYLLICIPLFVSYVDSEQQSHVVMEPHLLLK